MTLPCTASSNSTIRHQFNPDSILEEDVVKTLKVLRNKRSYGEDELTIGSFSNILDIIIKLYTYLLNTNPQKSDIRNIDKYRHISNICALAKVFEKVVANKIVVFVI